MLTSPRPVLAPVLPELDEQPPEEGTGTSWPLLPLPLIPRFWFDLPLKEVKPGQPVKLLILQQLRLCHLQRNQKQLSTTVSLGSAPGCAWRPE